MHVDDGVGQEVVSGHPERRGLSVTQRPERQQQHGQTHALEYGLELAGPCGGDDFAARTLHNEETHNGDTNFANQEQDGYPPAELAERGAYNHCAASQQLIRDRIHELAHFGDLIVFAGHPTVDFIGGRGDDEQHRGDPAHGQVVLTPGTGENVECQENHHEYDARVGDQVRRRVPSVEQR